MLNKPLLVALLHSLIATFFATKRLKMQSTVFEEWQREFTQEQVTCHVSNPTNIDFINDLVKQMLNRFYGVLGTGVINLTFVFFLLF